MWQNDFSIETDASPKTVWAVFCDIQGWKNWISGLDSIEMKGPFAKGTVYTFTPAGQGPLTSRLVEVKENEYFIDETSMGEVVVRVTHRIEALPSGRTRITYSPQVTGPSAEEIGKAISSDFPDVLKALAAYAASFAAA
jgi:carbon monoxide dehydrogenase subunit G